MDLKSAERLGRTQRAQLGTWQHMSPERMEAALCGRAYTAHFAADVWSVVLVLAEVAGAGPLWEAGVPGACTSAGVRGGAAQRARGGHS